jgi:hypothetical protein
MALRISDAMTPTIRKKIITGPIVVAIIVSLANLYVHGPARAYR